MSCRFLIAALLILVASACGPERDEPRGDEARRYAEVACGAIVECGCAPHFGDPQECAMTFEARFEEFIEHGYQLDLDCFELVVDSGEITDCAAVVEPPEHWSCAVLRHAKREGETCSDHQLELPPFAVQECAGGLVCLDGVCAPLGTVGPPLSEGDACFAEQAASCHVGGLYCSQAGICDVEPAEGAPCGSVFSCAFAGASDGGDLYCRGWSDSTNGTCTPQARTGQPCDPLDWSACTHDAGPGWCDPRTRRCQDGGPAICRLTDYPGARAPAP